MAAVFAFVNADAATRYHPITKAVLGPWLGSGCPDNGRCGCDGSSGLASEFLCQVNKLQQYDIPATVYLFDGGAWSNASLAMTTTCSGPDCCTWKLGDQVIARLNELHIRAIVHFWGGCFGLDQYPRVYGTLGKTLLGIYLDEMSSDQRAKEVVDYFWSVMPGNSECILKAYQGTQPVTSDQGLANYGNVCYLGDLPHSFAGLQEGINRLFLKSRFLPAPYNEFTAYQYPSETQPDAETYFRRLHFGCFQVVMANTPFANSDPWSHGYSSALLTAYRNYSWQHKELAPYLYSYCWQMHENSTQSVLRNRSSTYSCNLGNELFVQYVTTAGTRSMNIALPAGSEWINWWDDSQTYTGTAANYPVPLGKEPVFIRNGAIIPLDVEREYCGHGTRESKGSLTVLVYPKDSTSFKYRDDSLNAWITFTSKLANGSLSLSASPRPPALPVIYRIGRWPQAPTSVAVTSAGVRINAGGSALHAASEKELNGSSRSGWYYDAAAKRLIVKAVPGDATMVGSPAGPVERLRASAARVLCGLDGRRTPGPGAGVQISAAKGTGGLSPSLRMPLPER